MKVRKTISKKRLEEKISWTRINRKRIVKKEDLKKKQRKIIAVWGMDEYLIFSVDVRP